jgi:hypothetical protein
LHRNRFIDVRVDETYVKVEHGFRCGEKPVTADVGRQSEIRAVHRSQANGSRKRLFLALFTEIVERGTWVNLDR